LFRAVLDANQFVSAILHSSGNPAKALNAWRTGYYELVISPAIVEEIRRVLNYPRLAKIHRKSAVEIEEFLDDLCALAFLTPGKLNLPMIPRDPSDDIYIIAAVEGEARFIVSGDSDLLEILEYKGIRIVTAREFLIELS
jgi:putative PIN family toxin of toxin-antitoxin system